MKPGYKTTEFWTSLAAGLLGVATTLGLFTPDQAGDLVKAVEAIAGAVLTAAPIIGYALSRGSAKGGALVMAESPGPAVRP